jgi:hypothetical protein
VGSSGRGHVVDTGHGRALGIAFTGLPGAGRVDSAHGRDSGLGFIGEGERGHAFDSAHGRGNRITLAGDSIPSTETPGRGHVDSGHGRGSGITYTGGNFPLVGTRHRGRARSTHGGDVGVTLSGDFNARRVATNVQTTHGRAGAAASGGDPGRGRAAHSTTGTVGVAPTHDPNRTPVVSERDKKGETE